MLLGKPMRTVLFNLWPYTLRCVVVFLMVAGALAAGAWLCNSWRWSPVASYLVGGLTVFGLLAPFVSALQTWRWLLGFARHVKTFKTEKSDRVTLRYSPRFDDRNTVIALLRQIEHSLQELTERFGYSVGKQRFLTPYTIFASRRRTLTVYLLHDLDEAVRSFGWVGGYSLPPANAIVVVHQGSNPVFVARHEMVHMFAHYWNPAAPPLLGEGLATFLALGSENTATAPAYLSGAAGNLNDLLRDFFRLSRMRQNYYLAYVFVASLIHHFGWEKFQRFYRKATPLNFAKLFRKVYGVVLRDDLDFGKPWVGSLREYAKVGSLEGWPVEPAGIAVGSEMTLAPGTPVLASRQGSWWRANVIEIERDQRVRVRFVGWDESWDESLPRDTLQLEPGPMDWKSPTSTRIPDVAG